MLSMNTPRIPLPINIHKSFRLILRDCLSNMIKNRKSIRHARVTLAVKIVRLFIPKSFKTLVNTPPEPQKIPHMTGINKNSFLFMNTP